MALSGKPQEIASEIETRSETRYLGAALFSKNKMQGVFDGAQTILTNLLRSDVELFQYEYEGRSIEFVPEHACRIRIDTKAEPVQITISMRLAAVSQQEMPDLGSLKQAFEDDLRRVIRTAQDMGVDPFGFAEVAVRNFATIETWRNYNWPERFRNAKVEIDVHFSRSDA